MWSSSSKPWRSVASWLAITLPRAGRGTAPGTPSLSQRVTSERPFRRAQRVTMLHPFRRGSPMCKGSLERAQRVTTQVVDQRICRTTRKGTTVSAVQAAADHRWHHRVRFRTSKARRLSRAARERGGVRDAQFPTGQRPVDGHMPRSCACGCGGAPAGARRPPDPLRRVAKRRGAAPNSNDANPAPESPHRVISERARASRTERGFSWWSRMALKLAHVQPGQTLGRTVTAASLGRHRPGPSYGRRCHRRRNCGHPPRSDPKYPAHRAA
jgi:hypothetical protein